MAGTKEASAVNLNFIRLDSPARRNSCKAVPITVMNS
jgi:hypothetical protein